MPIQRVLSIPDSPVSPENLPKQQTSQTKGYSSDGQ